ncbi:MAG: signal peptide peptidase SppA [Polyangiales bacterium]
MKKFLFAAGLLVTFGITPSGLSRVHAEEMPLRAPRIVPPGRSLAGTDDSDAMALNPSQIGFMPSWEFRYSHVEIPKSSDASSPGRGDTVGLAFPLAFGLSTGFRFESVRPPTNAPIGAVQVFGWSLALTMGELVSYSLDVRNYRPNTDGLSPGTTFGLSYAMRPSPYLGIAFVARDLSASRGDIVAPGVGIERSLDLGFAIRPLGTKALELGLEGSWFPSAESGDQWGARSTLGVDLGLARVTGSFGMVDLAPGSARKNFNASLGVELGLGKMRVGGGALVANGTDSKVGWYATASLAGYKVKPELEVARAIKIRIEETPGSRGHVHLLRKLAKLGRDPSVRAVALVLKAEPAASTAHAEELADAIASLQARGVKVICHFEDGGGKGLLACSGARILLHPAGGIRFAGLRTQTMYFGEVLHKIGIEPDFLRIKEHKSAPEAFVRDGPTPVSAQDQAEFLAGVEDVYLTRIAAGRRLPRELVKKNIADGPFVADEAVSAGFADGKAFDDEVDNWIKKEVGPVRVEDEKSDPVAPKAFGKQPHIAVIYIDGDIVDGRSQHVPLLGTRLVGSYTIQEALEHARLDSSIKGVVLRIESPGGSSLASDVMWREAELLSKAKPVVVSMGSVAASGGYYAAAFGAPIYASAATVTGSIGIFYGKADVSPLLKKIGVNVVTNKTAPRADAESLYRPFTPEERVELGKKVAQFYAVFLDRVARGRGWTIEQVDKVAHGKVWLGAQAKKVGLVDEVGGFEAAFEAIRKRCDLPYDVATTELPVEKKELLDLVLDYLGAEAPAPNVAALPKALLPYVDAIAPFAVYAADQPLALWEGVGVP